MDKYNCVEAMYHYKEMMQKVMIYLSNGSRIQGILIKIQDDFVYLNIGGNKVIEILKNAIVKIIPHSKKEVYT